MSLLIDKDEGTAARRRVPFRVFLSNGTAPDTGVSNDTVMISVNGAAQLGAGSASAISAAAGMYYVELTQSMTSVLGHHPVWYDLGDFAQHVATVQVVNSNPYSTQSNVTAVGVSGINAGSYSGVTMQGVSNYANISTVTLHAGTHSGATIQGVSNYANISNVTLHAGTHSNVTIQGLGNWSNLSGTYSNLTVRLDAYDYSSVVTVGAGILAADSITATVIADNAIDAGAIAANAIAATKIAAGAITNTKFAAGALDAAAIASDAGAEIADAVLDRDMATGTDSGSSAVRTLRNAARALRNRVTSDATQIQVYKEDDATVAWTASISTVASTNAHISGYDPTS